LGAGPTRVKTGAGKILDFVGPVFTNMKIQGKMRDRWDLEFDRYRYRFHQTVNEELKNFISNQLGAGPVFGSVAVGAPLALPRARIRMRVRAARIRNIFSQRKARNR
jgi:hypothetical protein